MAIKIITVLWPRDDTDKHIVLFAEDSWRLCYKVVKIDNFNVCSLVNDTQIDWCGVREQYDIDTPSLAVELSLIELLENRRWGKKQK